MEPVVPQPTGLRQSIACACFALLSAPFLVVDYCESVSFDYKLALSTLQIMGYRAREQCVLLGQQCFVYELYKCQKNNIFTAENYFLTNQPDI